MLGVLRWQRLLDVVLSASSRRPVVRLDPEVRAVLRSALFEAAKLGVPAPVAVDAAVRLTRRLGKSSAAGFVNAVLRRAAARFDAMAAAEPLEIRYSHPGWLSRRWRAHFGASAAEAVMDVDQRPADLWLWCAGGVKALPGEIADQLEAHTWCPGAYRAAGKASAVIRAVREGLVYVQDPASQLVAHLAVALASGIPQPRLADVCAAPGGKAGLAAGLGAWDRVAAVELRIGRARLMTANLRRLGRPVAVVAGDAAQSPLAPRAWDVVMLDAPCSGTGTLRRHPDLKWRLEATSLGRLARAQAGMLRAAFQLLRPGGIVLYTTCSIEPEENEALFDGLRAPFEMVPLDGLMPAGCPAMKTAAGGVRLLPSADSDGFTFHAVRYNPHL